MKSLREQLNENLIMENFEFDEANDQLYFTEHFTDNLKIKPVSVDMYVDKFKRVEILVDYLKPQDYPAGYQDNSIVFQFFINLKTSELDIFRGRFYPYVYKSDEDAAIEENDYMLNVEMLMQKYGLKKFRKTKVKNIQDVIKKLNNFLNSAMGVIDDYTGGYPYQKGIKSYNKQ
jgi:hypothetical protein